MALSHLLERGVRLHSHEAVALAQKLMEHPCCIPTPENIQLGSDGCVFCTSTDGVPSVASVAGLLLTLLPPGTPNVPAPLRYAIARGIEAVEAPPFASLEEFSRTLERFEKGARPDVLSGILQRSAPSSSPIAEPTPLAQSAVTSSPVHSPRRWAPVAAAALLASFAVGFIVADISDRLTAPNRSASAREIVARPAPATADAPAHASTGTIDRPREQVRAVESIRATNAPAFSPAFASDGAAIFFHTGGRRDARSAIEVAAAGSQAGRDRGITTIVDDGSQNYHAQPSPDGRFVAFDSDRDGERAIYVANRDGSQVRRVSAAGYAAVPTWSRNSEWLAYIRTEADKPSVWNLWVQPAAGGSARRVTNYRYGQTWAASWFPDNRRIAFSHESTLTVMDLQTGKAIHYATPVKGRLVRTPAVSPDGATIIFQVFRHGVWLLNLADGSMRLVLKDPTAEEFAWSPDGGRIAFHCRRNGQWGIYVLSRG